MQQGSNRVIFHVDVNSAFLSWEAVTRLAEGEKVDLREIPSAVGGDIETRHGVILGCWAWQQQKYPGKTRDGSCHCLIPQIMKSWKSWIGPWMIFVQGSEREQCRGLPIWNRQMESRRKNRVKAE